MNRRPKEEWCAAPRAPQRSERRRARALPRVEELEDRRLLTAFYVSPNGNDNNSGTSPSSPWQTIDRVNLDTYRPGDEILFQGGATFNGDLTLNKSDVGTPASPIIISSYGSGPATINAGTGIGISLFNTQGISISNLVIVGSGYATNTSDGIYLINDQPGTTHGGFTINQVDVSGFGHVGIHFLTQNGGNYSGISITNSSTHDNGYGGIYVEARLMHASDVYVGDVQSYHNAGAPGVLASGYGIKLLGVTDGVVERSETYDNGWSPESGGASGGISALACNRILLQYNESYDNHHGKSDGNGVVLDVTTNSIMQFNYTHDNDGSGLWLGAETGYAGSNNVVRYNISQNDARSQVAQGGILLWQNVSNSDIYNNTVFISPSADGDSTAIRVHLYSGSSVQVHNNIFITTGGVPLVDYDGGGTNLLFQGNDYWSSGAPFAIQWVNQTFGSVGATRGWSAGTGQETMNGAEVGYQVNPQVNNPGGGGTMGNSNLLGSLTAYQLSSASPLAQAGLDLSRFAITWDPYGFANDPFLGPHFNAIPKDFSSGLVPIPGSNLFSPGAEQVVLPPVYAAQAISLPTPRPHRRHKVTQIIVSFSGAVNGREADNRAIYHLVRAGRRGSFTARNAMRIKLRSAVYNAANHTVTLTPRRPFFLVKPVELTIEGVGPSGLEDDFGRLIAGANNGQTGENAVILVSRNGVTVL
jgi:hypothetical protein